MPTYENTGPQGDWPRRPQPPAQWSKLPPKPHRAEDTLKSNHVDIERKRFVFHLKENDRGRLLRITEETGNKRASIIIPSTGLKEFADLLQTMLDACPPEAAK